jgi:hypothetical protein
MARTASAGRDTRLAGAVLRATRLAPRAAPANQTPILPMQQQLFRCETENGSGRLSPRRPCAKEARAEHTLPAGRASGKNSLGFIWLRQL